VFPELRNSATVQVPLQEMHPQRVMLFQKMNLSCFLMVYLYSSRAVRAEIVSAV
jgi:hypothetical protein